MLSRELQQLGKGRHKNVRNAITILVLHALADLHVWLKHFAVFWGLCLLLGGSQDRGVRVSAMPELVNIQESDLYLQHQSLLQVFIAQCIAQAKTTIYNPIFT